MRLTGRVRKLEAAVPTCDGRVLRLAGPAYVPGEADRCRVCGGCHVLVIEEEIVEAGADGPVPVSAGGGNT